MIKEVMKALVVSTSTREAQGGATPRYTVSVSPICLLASHGTVERTGARASLGVEDADTVCRTLHHHGLHFIEMSRNLITLGQVGIPCDKFHCVFLAICSGSSVEQLNISHCHCPFYE